MKDPQDKPDTPGEALEHHGVKGMKWGVRKDEQSGGGDPLVKAKALAADNEKTKMYMEAAQRIPKPATQKEAERSLQQQREKFAAKFEGSDPPSKGPSGKVENSPRLSPEQKKALLYIGGTAAIVGGAYLASRYVKNQNALKIIGEIEGAKEAQALNAQFGLGHIPSDLGKPLAEIDRLAGKPVDEKTFYGLVGFSQGRVWPGEQYLTPNAFARPEFELPAGHTFFRLSTQAETQFKKATYSCADLDDFSRYVAGFRSEIGGPESRFYQVTWKTKTSTKVPNLTTVLSELHGVMREGYGHDVSPDLVTRHYASLSGSGWNSEVGQKLINRLKSRGYGAIIDEMDAGIIGEKPLVFFGDNVTPKSAKELSPSTLKAFEAFLREIPKPPGRKY